MHAALQTDIGKIEVDWVGRVALGFGQVNVRMIAAGICGAQLMELDGYKESGPFPHIMGHEGVGIVQEVGHGVTTVKSGDKVVLHWRKGGGIESDFPTYLHNGYKMTSGKCVTWAEEVTVSENRVTRVDQDAPDELCVLLGCGLSTALGTLEQEANLKIGESILIIGCGGLGLNLIRAARIRGASQVYAVDSKVNKLDPALNAGCNVVGWVETPYKFPKLAFKFDVIVDTSGNSQVISDSLEYLGPSGRFIMVGQPKAPFAISRNMFEGEGKTIKATQGGGFRPHVDLPRYVAAWRAGVISLDGIITHRIKLNDIHKGIELVRNGEAGRILIEL